MKLTSLVINPVSLGERMWLTEIRPVYAYINNVKTNEIIGHKYSLVLPDKGLERIDVKIEGRKRMDAPEGYVEVEFEDLELYIYWYQKGYKVGARATDIRKVEG